MNYNSARFLNNNQSNTTTPTPTINTSPSPVETALVKKVFYQRNINNKKELWSINIDGTENQIVNIPNLTKADNYSGSDHFSYTKDNEYNSIYLDNYLLTDNHKINIPNGANYSTNLQSRSFSTNGNYFIYSAIFFEVCYNEGPCPEYDPSPEYQKGMYLYNLETKASTFIGNYVLVNNWSSDNTKVFFTESDFEESDDFIKPGLYEYEIKTKTPVLKNSQNLSIFGYIEYQLENGIKYTYSAPSTTTLTTLIISQNGVEKYKEESAFAGLQPFFIVSPNQKYGLFYKTVRINPSTLSEYNLVNLTDLTVKKISTPTSSNSMGSGYWYDDENYVYLNNLDQNNFDKNNIKIYNVITGQHTLLVSTENIVSFTVN
jgi:hypothetical protein